MLKIQNRFENSKKNEQMEKLSQEVGSFLESFNSSGE